MNVHAAFRGDYLAGIEFGEREPTFTIDHVKVVELEGDDGKIKPKPVVYVKETDRGWVLCRTSAHALSQLFGTPETAKWTGRRVTLHAVEVLVGSERKPGIRVKGSPDITAPISFVLKLPKRKAQTITLVPTKANPAAPPPRNAPASGPAGGEPAP